MQKPLAIDLFCGLGGWTDGLLAEGYDVIGVDIEEHAYGDMRYQGKLLIQDVTTLHGSQFKDAALIVASPPCQKYSYMAMPWKLAKAEAVAIRADTTGEKLAALNRLFNECFRIQREASFAAGRYVPMVVENVRGAQPWVGRARWNFGSFYLWGDVPALMPTTSKAIKVPMIGSWYPPDHPKHVKGLGFNTHADRNLRGKKGVGPKWDPVAKSGLHGMARWTNPAEGRKAENVVVAALEKCGDGRKGYAARLGESEILRAYSSKSPQRKMASAMIAKIPLPLSRHIASVYRP